MLLITPRVVRNLDALAAARYEYASGTESAVGAPPVRLQGSGRIAIPPGAGGARGAQPEQAAQPEAEPAPAPQ